MFLATKEMVKLVFVTKEMTVTMTMTTTTRMGSGGEGRKRGGNGGEARKGGGARKSIKCMERKRRVRKRGMMSLPAD